MGVANEKGSTALLRYSPWRSAGQTMTMRPMSPTASKASTDQVRIGLPPISTSCLPPSLPKRSPVPPAKMMAAVFGFLSTLPSRPAKDCVSASMSSAVARSAAASTEDENTGSTVLGMVSSFRRKQMRRPLSGPPYILKQLPRFRRHATRCMEKERVAGSPQPAQAGRSESNRNLNPQRRRLPTRPSRRRRRGPDRSS